MMYFLAAALAIFASCELLQPAITTPKSTSTDDTFYDPSETAPSLNSSSMSDVCTAIVKEVKLMAKRPSSLKPDDDQKAQFLASHNDIRKRYNLEPLTWDEDLARHAKDWAHYLKEKNRCEMAHRSHKNMREGKQYGENLARFWTSKNMPAGSFHSSPEWAVFGWSEECKDYNHETNYCPKTKMCGHFTQVVWQDTSRVGCALITCDGVEHQEKQGRVELAVCNYDPPGNWVGKKPF